MPALTCPIGTERAATLPIPLFAWTVMTTLLFESVPTGGPPVGYWIDHASRSTHQLTPQVLHARTADG